MMARDNIISWPAARAAQGRRALDSSAAPDFIRSDNIRSVAPIKSADVARILGDPDELIDLYRSREEQERIDRIIVDIAADDARVKRLQKCVAWACIAAAYFAIIYFAWQLGRGAL